MSHRYLNLIALLVGFAQSNPVEGLFSFDDSYSGTAALAFLKLQPNARSLSMGSALSSIDRGAQSYYSNPALLSTEKTLSLSINHAEVLGEWQHESAVISFPMLTLGTWALGINAVHSDDFDTARDELEDLNSFSTNDLDIGLAYGFNLIEEQLDLGINLKYLQSRLDDVTGRGYSANIGLRAYLIADLQMALVLRNLSHGFRYRANGPLENTPTTLQTSIGLPLGPEYPFAAQLSYEKSNEGLQVLALGYEHVITPWFFARVGYRLPLSSNDQGWGNGLSSGIGLIWGPFAIDYGAQYRDNLGWHQIFSFQFGSFPTHKLSPKTPLEKAINSFHSGECGEAQRYASEALQYDPSHVKAHLILENCKKEKAIAQGEIFNLLVSSNTHGQLNPIKTENKLLGGLPRRASLIDELRSRDPHVFLIDAGMWQAPKSNERNTLILKSYEQMNYDFVFSSLCEQDCELKKTPIDWQGKRLNLYRLRSLDLDSQQIQTKIDSAIFSKSQKNILILNGYFQQALQIAKTNAPIDLIVLSGGQAQTPTALEVNATKIISPGTLGTHLSWVQLATDTTSNYFFYRNLEVHSGLKPKERIRNILKSQILYPEDTLNSSRPPIALKQSLTHLKAVEGDSTLFDLHLYDGKVSKRISKKPIEINKVENAWSRQIVAYSAIGMDGADQLFLQHHESKKTISLLNDKEKLITFKWDQKENFLWFWTQKASGEYILQSIRPSGHDLKTHQISSNKAPNKLSFSPIKDFIVFDSSDSVGNETLYLSKTYYFHPVKINSSCRQIVDFNFSLNKDQLFILCSTKDPVEGVVLINYDIEKKKSLKIRTKLSHREIYPLPNGIALNDPRGLTDQILIDQKDLSKERPLVNREDLQIYQYNSPKFLNLEDKWFLFMNRTNIQSQHKDIIKIDLDTFETQTNKSFLGIL